MAFCSQCGTTLPDDARFCPKCGTEAGAAESAAAFAAAPQPAPRPELSAAPPPAGSGSGWILPVVIVVAVAIIGVFLWSQRDGARPIAGNASEQAERAREETPSAKGEEASDTPATEEAEAPAQPAGDSTTTTAAALDSAFYSDPQAARERYTGPVTVSGTIATMVTPGASPSLSLEGRTRLNFVVASFPSGYGPQLADLAKGQRITVACKRVTGLAGTTILQDCALQ